MTLSQSINWRGRLTEFTQKSDLKPPQVIEVRSRGWPGTFSFVCELAWGNKILRTCGTAMKKKFAKREAARLMCCRVADLTDELLENPMCNPHNPNDEGYWGPFYPYIARSSIPAKLDELSAPELTPPRCPSINKRNYAPLTRRTKSTIDRAYREVKRDVYCEFRRDDRREVYKEIPSEILRPPQPIKKKVPDIEYKSFSEDAEPSFEDLLRLHKPDIQLNNKEKVSPSGDVCGRYLKSPNKAKPGVTTSESEEQRSNKRKRSFSGSPKAKKLKQSKKRESCSKKKKRKKHKVKKRSKKAKKKKSESKYWNKSGTPSKRDQIPIVILSDSGPSLEPPSGINVEGPKNFTMPPLEPDSPIRDKKIMIILDEDDENIKLSEELNLKTDKLEKYGDSNLSQPTSRTHEGVQCSSPSAVELKLEAPCFIESDSLLDWISHPSADTSESASKNQDNDEVLSEEKKKIEIITYPLKAVPKDNEEKADYLSPNRKKNNEFVRDVTKQVTVSRKHDQSKSSDKALADKCQTVTQTDIIKYKPEPKVIQQCLTPDRNEKDGSYKKHSPTFLKTSKISDSGKANLAVRICSNAKIVKASILEKIPKKSTSPSTFTRSKAKFKLSAGSFSIFDPTSLLKRSPTRSCLRRPGDQKNGGRVRFLVGNVVTTERPDYLPVLKKRGAPSSINYNELKTKHLRFAEVIIPEIIPRKGPAVPLSFRKTQGMAEDSRLTKSIANGIKPFRQKWRSPPPKKKCNVVDLRPLSIDSTANCRTEPMAFDVKKTLTTPSHRKSSISPDTAFHEKFSLPDANQKSALSDPLSSPQSKLFVPSPRRSLRLSKLRSNSDLGNEKTTGARRFAGNTNLSEDEAPFGSSITASAAVIMPPRIKSSNIESIKHSNESGFSPGRRSLVKKRVLKRKPGGKGSRKKKVEKRKIASKC